MSILWSGLTEILQNLKEDKRVENLGKTREKQRTAENCCPDQKEKYICIEKREKMPILIQHRKPSTALKWQSHNVLRMKALLVGIQTNTGKKDSKKSGEQSNWYWLVYLLLVLFLEILVNIKCIRFCMTLRSK